MGLTAIVPLHLGISGCRQGQRMPTYTITSGLTFIFVICPALQAPS